MLHRVRVLSLLVTSIKESTDEENRYCFAGSGGNGSAMADGAAWDPALLGRRCPLFARKFLRDAASALPTALEATAVLTARSGD